MKYTLTAEVEAEEENDARAKFVDLIPFLLVNDIDEIEGVTATITHATLDD